MFKEPPVFHVGFGKSGSTYFQKKVFPRLPRFEYLGQYPISDGERQDESLPDIPYLSNPNVKKLYSELFKKDSMAYRREYAQSLLIDSTKDIKDKRIIFSSEFATSVLFSYPDIAIKAKRLHDLFNELKIIIIIREQRAILASRYRAHPFNPTNPIKGRPVSFEEWVRITMNLKYFSFADYIHYDQVHALYSELFGRDKVLILPLELMSRDAGLFSDRFGGFIDVDASIVKRLIKEKPVNIGASKSYNRWRRLRSRLPASMSFRAFLPKNVFDAGERLLRLGSKEKLTLSVDLERELRDRYSESNKRIAQECDLPMGELGYSV